jgi:hypothetical protein
MNLYTKREINNVCRLSNCNYIKTCVRTFKLKHQCLDEIKRGN